MNNYCRTRRARVRRSAFSLVELLVVIAIVAILAGVILVALNAARNSGLRAATLTVMQSFAQAAETFEQEHGVYPGVIPDSVLAMTSPEPITGTENALLHMMGGYRVMKTPEDVGTPTETEYMNFQMEATATGTFVEINLFDGWMLGIDLNRIGEGPVIKGRSYAPYFLPDENQMLIARGQADSEDDVPDLIDSWGQPIVYIRRQRTRGPLVPDPINYPDVDAQFEFNSTTNLPIGTAGYLTSTGLGALDASQVNAGSSQAFSVLNDETGSDVLTIFETLIENPSLGATARGAIMLFSAGPDGIYFSSTDGPAADNKAVGSPAYPYANYIADIQANPAVLDEYDDIRVFGGG